MDLSQEDDAAWQKSPVAKQSETSNRLGEPPSAVLVRRSKRLEPVAAVQFEPGVRHPASWCVSTSPNVGTPPGVSENVRSVTSANAVERLVPEAKLSGSIVT